MRVLHINSYYSGSKLYKNLYDQQEKNGLDISVFLPVASQLDNNDDFGEYTTISVNHKKYDRFIFHLKHSKILKDITNKYDMEKYSLIHAHSLFSNGYVAMKLKEKYGIPYMVAVRNTDVNTFFKRMVHLRKMGIRILENADQVIFLSKSYRDKVIEKYVPVDLKAKILNKTLIIPNGIDDFWLKNRGNIRTTPNKKDLRLLYVGVINKNKNVTTTIKALDLLIKEGIKARLTVVGRIEDQSIYDHIKTLNYVEYIEPKPKEELIKIYRQNDIFVMPSIHESFGLVYVEAMSQGLPVIYTKGEGFDGQFENGVVGYGVDCFSAKEITDRIKDILCNYLLLTDNCVQQTGIFRWCEIAEQYNKALVKLSR